MRLLNFVIVVGLGFVFFSLLGGRLHFRMPEALRQIGATLNPALAGKTVVKVNPAEPKPTVHVKNLASVRGKVIAIEGDAALVDCDQRGVISAATRAQWAQIRTEDGDSGRGNYEAMAQAKADIETFGELKIMDEGDKLVIADHSPGSRSRGKLLLRGLAVGVGDPVHVVTMSLGQTQNGVPVHTARFLIQGGAWMWKGSGGRTMLDRRGAGNTALDSKVGPSCPSN